MNKQNTRDRIILLLFTQSVQLQRLVQDLFDLASMEQQSFSHNFQRTSIDKVIDDTPYIVPDWFGVPVSAV
ncbi:hypothetical protein L1N85_17465 [Paenibacillus alkaliterrae]|uniref:hypothetical protein n=1 Tax=Paenibacillus alkaliterrae TaxID=320909 RepID=UPI001F1DCCF2|nr:hypothetical protein [Paenibacillus alkaliterrae]MCF2940195.1 hypothetical protein [Paenibacillus alkaliterrae]